MRSYGTTTFLSLGRDEPISAAASRMARCSYHHRNVVGPWIDFPPLDFWIAAKSVKRGDGIYRMIGIAG